MAPTTGSSSSASAPSSTPRSSQPSRAVQRLNILDLPLETQHAIFSHCDTPELVSLSVVSKRFHELAAAQLYRSFSVVLANPYPPTRSTPLAYPGNVTLTGGLDTLTTSSYDYARFLKHFALDTRSANDRATPSHLSLQYSVHGGRFLNTLLHLALRNARTLESFKWNISVELDRRVFKTLHQLPYLNELHIRWHVGSSHYESLRPLPLQSAASTESFGSPMPSVPHHPHSQGPPPPPVFGSATTQFYNNGLQSHFAPVHASPPHVISTLAPPAITVVKPAPPRRAKREAMAEDPPTLSGFKYLRRLTVLNIECLDLIPEIKSCISNSESTLTDLSLSFSNVLAQEARVADLDQDPETTELDDDIHGPEHTTASRPPLAQKAWKIQETVLARILNVDKSRHKRNPPSQGGQDERDEGSSENREQSILSVQKKKSPEEAFIAALKEASEQLLTIRGAEGLSGHSDGIVNVIEEAVGNYFESDAAKQKPADDENDTSATDTFEKSSSTGDISESPIKHKSLVNPNDKSPADSIDIELSEPEEDESQGGDPSEDSDSLRHEPSSSTGATENNYPYGMKSSDSGRATGSQSPSTSMIERENRSTDDDEAEKKQLMSAYVKSTRGLGLTSLTLHLIPVKASVLNSALDLHVLQSLTLLNVGHQAAVWALLSKENQVKPLALRNIFTDNVSPAFLKCVSQLEKIYEIFMIERSPRYRPATFVAPTAVTIHGIRKHILKKHLGSLKRVMIRNDATHQWDLDAKTITLVCARGVRLEELSAGFHMRGVHILLQHFAGLRNLHALHISPFRNDDTCAWAIQETTKFFVDSLVRYPHHKLEWLGVGDRARLVRRDPPNKPTRSKKEEQKKKKQAADKKGKGKAVTVGGGDSGVEEVTLAFSADLWSYPSDAESSEEDVPDDSESDSDSDADDTSDEFEEMLKLRSVRQLLDYVDGVRIFEKEVRAGEL